MNLDTVLDRFKDSSFILYGGTDTILALLQSKGVVDLWYTDVEDSASVPIKRKYTDLFRRKGSDITIYDSVYVVVGTGNMGTLKAERAVMEILGASTNKTKVCIFHGYPNFVTTSLPVVKETYSEGCVISAIDDRVLALQRVATAIRSINEPEIAIPVPLRDMSLVPIERLQPYIHLVSKIEESKNLVGIPEIPLTNQMPVNILDPDTSPQLEYVTTKPTSAVNWGQRKLLISEIEMLVRVIDHDIKSGGSGKGFVLVYVGAAPGYHIPYLLNLFATFGVTAHLWDRKASLKSVSDLNDSRIKIVPQEFEDTSMTGESEGFFTDVVAQKYKDIYGTNNRLIFVSDIRTTIAEEYILQDMESQKNWVLTMQPYATQLKFILSKTDTSLYEYLGGDIYTQAWGRNKTTETRLVALRPYSMKVYDPVPYNNAMFYLNMNTRLMSYDLGSVINTEIGSNTGIGKHIITSDGLCTCHDCAREVQVISKWYKLYKRVPNEKGIVAFVGSNTINCRPIVGRETNTRSLWSRVQVKVPDRDRAHLVLFRQLPPDSESLEKTLNKMWESESLWSKSLSDRYKRIAVNSLPFEDLIIQKVSKILVYADDMAPEEIVNALVSKPEKVPSILGPNGISKATMIEVLKGKRYPVVIDFHTDFGRVDESGQSGARKYSQFLQDTVLASRSKIHDLDVFGSLMLFLIANK